MQAEIIVHLWPKTWFVLWFYGSFNNDVVMSSMSFNLITLLLGRLRLHFGLGGLTHSFASNALTTALLESAGENDSRKYFVISLHKRM